MGMDVWEVIDAAATKPFGFMPFYPGPGLGGHCIPVDPFYLSWKAREYDFSTRFIELAGEVNTAMPYHVVDSVAARPERSQEEPEGREAPDAGRGLQEGRGRPARIAHAQNHGASPAARRRARLQRSLFPAAAQNAALRLCKHEIRAARSPASWASYDGVIIATDHSSYDYVRDRGSPPSWLWIRATPRGASSATAKKSCSARRRWPPPPKKSERSSRKALA